MRPDGNSTHARRPISAGFLRAVIFVLLVATAIGFWVYTRHIINHVREFQKSVVTTQKEIYKGIIDPMATDSMGISSELFQKGVIESPFPIIFTDGRNRPIPGLWRNVGVDPGDQSEEAAERLATMARRMDRINPPDSIQIQTMQARADTLLLYEWPPEGAPPHAVTDEIGTPLLIANLRADTADTLSLIQAISELDPNPVRFSRPGEPSIALYGTTGHGAWPVVVATAAGEPLYWKGFSRAWADTASVPDLADFEESKASADTAALVTGHITAPETMLLHYGDPAFLSLIVWLPVMEIGVIIILIAIGFIGLMSISRAEQRSIWVGMAKETAHQLGTPITSIDGWLELLKSERDEALIDQAVKEIGTDVARLSRVAARFSNIGSRPELQPLDVSDVVEEVLDYFRKRVPKQGISIEPDADLSHLRPVNGNRELLNWAFENLVKNSLASIENRTGRVTVTGAMSKDFSSLVLDFRDNGRGIPAAIQNRIMNPGFTTKKRGWGLGLSLVKRIIEDYHGGSVFLLESRINEGSTFRVILPAADEEKAFRAESGEAQRD
jgi:signal transduction histidine kinase